MSRAEQLPEVLRELAYRNCIELTHARWRSDIQLLVEALRRLVVDSNPSRNRQRTPPISVSRAAGRCLDASARDIRNAAQKRGAIRSRYYAARESGIGSSHWPDRRDCGEAQASGCTSTEDLYLKVSEEIESPQEREKFLRRQNLISSTRFLDDKRAVASLSNLSSTSSSVSPVTNPSRPTPVPSAIKKEKSSSPQYLLLIVVRHPSS